MLNCSLKKKKKQTSLTHLLLFFVCVTTHNCRLFKQPWRCVADKLSSLTQPRLPSGLLQARSSRRLQIFQRAGVAFQRRNSLRDTLRLRRQRHLVIRGAKMRGKKNNNPKFHSEEALSELCCLKWRGSPGTIKGRGRGWGGGGGQPLLGAISGRSIS